jgi:hypothetical protein
VRGENKPQRPPLWIAAAELAMLAGFLGWGYYPAAPAAALKPLVRLDVDLGPDVSLDSERGATGTTTILSADGTRLVYLSRQRLFTPRLVQ